MSNHCFGQRGVCRAGLVFFVFFVFFIGTGQASAATCAVTVTGTNGGTGVNWLSPMDLQTALGDVNCTEVWVERGMYTPLVVVMGSANENQRMISFDIMPGVAVYGGFSGDETARNDRDPDFNVTILSGDIEYNDANADGNNINETSDDIVGSNSYHVVNMDGNIGANITASTVLDGFVITGGQADGTGSLTRGGGLTCNGSGSENECSPTLSNTIFSGNKASGNGAAIYNNGGSSGISSPTINNVAFSGNSARSGGAIYNNGAGGVSSPVLSKVTFSANSATTYGGAMCNIGNSGDSSPTLSNVTFSGNESGNSGGAMFNSGIAGIGSPILYNVTFNGNSAVHGGAIFNVGSSGVSKPVLSNVILWGNTVPALGTGPQIRNFVSGDSGIAEPTIDHSVVESSGGSGSWDIDLGIDGGNNMDADPLLSELGNYGGDTLTQLLDDGSSAIDTGSAATCNDASTVNKLDQRGVLRPVGAGCDIGAVEMFEDDVFEDGFEQVVP